MRGRMPRLVPLLSLLLACLCEPTGAWTCQDTCPDREAQKLSYGGNVTVTVIRAINLPDRDVFGALSGLSDPYVEVGRGRGRGRKRHIIVST